MTDAERTIWFAVRDRRLGGFKFRRQVTIGRYVVDFACAEAALIVEVDGGQHSDDIDRHRTMQLQDAGYRVIRFWNNDVHSNLAGVLETLRDHLPPSPAGGRGPG